MFQKFISSSFDARPAQEVFSKQDGRQLDEGGNN
jgi:hypothetical protein